MNGCVTDHDRLQHGDEAAEATPLLHQRLPHRLLLRLLQQQVFITDILHGAVQLRLEVPAACRHKHTHARTSIKMDYLLS